MAVFWYSCRVKQENLRDAVFGLKPHFGAVVRTWGDATLLEYYAQDFPLRYEPSHDVLEATAQEASLLLGPQIGAQTYEALKSEKWVNTADHHSLLCHPYFYTTALARSHASVRKHAVTVTLPFGGISLGNDSFPRGLFFHDAVGKTERIFFKSLKDRRMPVHALSPMSQHDLAHERERTHSFDLSPDAHERIHTLLTKFLLDERIWNQETYSAQLTIMNSLLWQELFGESRGENVYLEIDSVVRRLLMEKHLVSDTVICNLLFKEEWRDAFVELFSGVFGSHDAHSGTHFFWYIDYGQRTRRRLLVHHGALVTREGDVQIPLTSESIFEGLRTRTLMPSTALILILIHGVEKLACGGGHSQLTYLSVMMEQWNILLARFGHVARIPTTNIYCGDNTLFQVTSRRTNTHHLATCIDLLLYSVSISQVVDEALEVASMNTAVDALLPTLQHLYSKQPIPHDVLCTLPEIIM